jgi:transposase
VQNIIGLNRKEKEKLVVELYENGSSYHEIAKEARVSLRDIKGILDKANGVHTMSKSSQAYQMFSEGKSPTEVAITLDIREPEVTQLYRESWTLKQIYDLNCIYQETNGNLGPIVQLYNLSREAGLNAEHIVRILKFADGDLPHLEGRCYNLKSEVKYLEAKKENLVRIMHEYENQVSVLGRSFDNYCRLCTEEELKLNDLQRKKSNAEALVSHFENNEYHKVRNFIKEKVYAILSKGEILLKLATFSVIQSIINNPEYYSLIINDTLLPATQTMTSNLVNTNNWTTQSYEAIIMNEARKLYEEISKNLVEKILDKYDVGVSQSSLPLL